MDKKNRKTEREGKKRRQTDIQKDGQTDTKRDNDIDTAIESEGKMRGGNMQTDGYVDNDPQGMKS